MIAAGKMMPGGLELYNYARENGLLPVMDEVIKPEGMFPEVPEFFTQALRKNPEAEKAFNSLAPSYRLHYLGWILDAKKEETRMRRLKEAIELLESGKKLGVK